MPHPLPAFAALLAAPLLGLAVHTASTHAAGASTPARAAATLPNNLCASCHGGGRVVSNQVAGALDARDLAAARSYLGDVTRG
jgi:mono/diheme cytochrome c family protein